MNWISRIEKLPRSASVTYRCNPPVVDEELAFLAAALEVRLPEELRQLYLLTDGLAEELQGIGTTGYLVLPAQELLHENQRLRQSACFCVHDLLLVAPAYTGDYYGYLIADDGSVSTDIYIWSCTDNTRVRVAASLAEFLVSWVSSELTA
ncbi:SMI1/KNR4 family protein [Hymenobacter latericus]|uniref:SMI1/KNR4 family protein n=1 Tax=Hymenobacter sp. YIM 151858-1 TaxID=2987688 RepID=UPI002226299C|nr:SMI1/KNR4 family protein [Hymenobacter sp. YIM 151858-1]UYZ60019.1 SMI1/KNR4 family protein [Hymenobacter sp. YIM 151858-1]